jgi:hypothetical protein
MPINSKVTVMTEDKIALDKAATWNPEFILAAMTQVFLTAIGVF